MPPDAWRVAHDGRAAVPLVLEVRMRTMTAERVKPSTDQQVEEMLADPEAYFAKVRREARDEAELYLARRKMGLAPDVHARPKRRRRGSFYLRMRFADGREFVISGTPPITVAEYDAMLDALTELRPGLSADPEGEL